MSLLRSEFGVLMLLAFASAGPAHPVDSKPVTDFYGDSLPPGAIARMGTTRLRHGKAILDYALSPDGKHVTSFGAEGLLVEWSAESGKELRRCILPHGPFTAAALSADRKLLATVGKDGRDLTEGVVRIVRLWDATTGKEIRKITDSANRFGGIAFASDGKTLATMGQDRFIHLWDVPSGRLVRRIDGEGDLKYQAPMAFSPSGDALVSGGQDGKMRVWEVHTGKKIRELFGRTPELVGKVVFSRDGKRLVSAGPMNNVVVWNAADGKEIRRFGKAGTPFDPVSTSLGFAPDGKSVLFGDKDGLLCEWDVTTGQERRRFQVGGSRPTFSADGATLAVVRGKTIAFWDFATGTERFAPAGHCQGVVGIALSPDARTLATTSGRDGFRLWDVATGKPHGGLLGHPQHSRIAFSPDGKTIATAGNDINIRLWDAATGKETRVLAAHMRSLVYGLAFRPDGTLVSGGQDGLRLADPSTGDVTLLAERPPVFALAVSPDGRRLFAQSGNTLLSFWDLVTRKQVLQLPVEMAIFGPLALSPDGNWFANADLGNRGVDQSVQLYATASGKKVRQFAKGFGRFGPSCGIAFSRDGRTLATGGTDDIIVRVWEIHSGQQRMQFAGHADGVGMIVFHPNGSSIISGGGEGVALVWDVSGHMPARDLTPTDLDRLWTDLAKGDGAKAYHAIQTLAAAPKQAVPFLAKHVQLAKAVLPERLAALLKALGSDKLNERNKAALELESLGDRAEIALRKAAADNLPLEHTRRIHQLLDKLPAPLSPEQLRDLRAVEALERIGTADARQILAALTKGPPSAYVTQDAHGALERLAKNAKTP
jgi:WD40 repeat protein